MIWLCKAYIFASFAGDGKSLNRDNKSEEPIVNQKEDIIEGNLSSSKENTEKSSENPLDSSPKIDLDIDLDSDSDSSKTSDSSFDEEPTSSSIAVGYSTSKRAIQETSAFEQQSEPPKKKKRSHKFHVIDD